MIDEEQIFWYIIIGTGIIVFLAALVIIFFLFSRKQIFEKELEKQNLKLKHKEDLLNATIITQEKERARIARDIHDEVSSKLNVIVLNMNLLQDEDVRKSEMAEEISLKAKEIGTRALENARRISHDLLPPVLENFGLFAAIEEIVDEFNTIEGLKVNLKYNWPKGIFTKPLQIHVYRIVQELLNNSVRHGKSTTIFAEFIDNQGELKMAYVDNGCGFLMNDPKITSGLGMKNIESRVNLLGGSWDYWSKPGEGVKINTYFKPNL